MKTGGLATIFKATCGRLRDFRTQLEQICLHQACIGYGALQGLYRDNGKENGNYCIIIGLYRGRTSPGLN